MSVSTLSIFFQQINKMKLKRFDFKVKSLSRPSQRPIVTDEISPELAVHE